MKSAVRSIHTAAWLFAATTMAAHAQASFGVGNVLCSQYIKAARGSDILYHQASNWLLGYVSGMNGALKATAGSAPAINLSTDQVLKSAGDYCEAHPTSTLGNAVGEWYALLPKQAEPPARQAESGSSSGGSLILNLDRSPKIKPLLDRR